MILIDFYQTLLSDLLQEVNIVKNEENLRLDNIRFMFLNTIKTIIVKFRESGKLVIACDSKNFWRTKYFSFYKKNRKRKMNCDVIDFNEIFRLVNIIKKEINDNFPYVLVEIDTVEADDIIAVLTKEYYQKEKIIIVSGDKDFFQLQKYSNVFQYDISKRKFLIENNPAEFLKKSIILGDIGDGVPNIFSDDDVFINKKKTIRRIKKETMSIFLNNDNITNFLSFKEKNNLSRNLRLIDFDYIPEDISNKILSYYKSWNTYNDIISIYKYLLKHKMKSYLINIGDFYQDEI